METACSYCKTAFIPKRADARYCSHSCRQLAYVLRKAMGADKSIGELTDKAKQSINLKKEDQRFLIDKATCQQSSDNELTGKRQKTSNLAALNTADRPTNESHNDGNAFISVNKDRELSINQLMSFDQQNSAFVNKPYIEWESSFIKGIMELSEQRNYVSELSRLIHDPSVIWISLRYKCLLECLLCFSEMQLIELDDLKEVCNAFTAIIYSRYYKYLPKNYPYTSEIAEIKDHIKNLCLDNEGGQEYLKFQFKQETKQKIIAARWELSQHIPKRNFNQLAFKE